MANNSILFEVIVTDKGLQVVEKKLDGVTSSANRATGATERMSKSQKNNAAQFNKQQKGVAQATSNSTKSFAKQAQFIQGGLVPAYAEIASRVFAITAFFGALQRAAQTEKLAQGLEVLGVSSGVALTTLSKGLQEATGFALSMEESMRSTNLVISAGFDSSSIERLGEVARTASIALGRDTADSLSRLTRGATKLEPELLDELGIMVRLDEATSNYASKIGKTVSELTNFERRQAFMNAVLEEGEKKFSALAGVDVSAYDKIAATFNDLSKTLLNVVNFAFSPLLKVLASSKILLLGFFTAFGATVLRSIAPGLSDLGSRYSDLRAQVKASTLGQIQSLSVLKNTGPAFAKVTEQIEAGVPIQEALNTARASMAGTLGQLTKKHKKMVLAEGEASEGARRLKAEIDGQRKSYRDLGVTIQGVVNAQQNLTNEQQISTLLGTGRFAEAWAQAKELFANYGSQIGEAGKDQGAFHKILAKLGPIFGATATAARIAGTAISLAIPIFTAITVIIGAFDVMMKGVTWVMEKFAPAAAAANAASAKLKETVSELEKTFKQLNATANGSNAVYKTLTARTTAAANAYSNLAAQSQIAYDALLRARKLGETPVNTLSGLRSMRDAILASDELTERYKKMYDIEGDVGDHIMERAGGNAVGALRTMKSIIEDVLDPQKKFTDELNNSNLAATVAAKGVRDLYNSIQNKTPFDQAVADVTDLSKNLNNLAKRSGKESVQAFANLQEQLDKGSYNQIIDPHILKMLKDASVTTEEQAKNLFAMATIAVKQKKESLVLFQTESSIAKSKERTAQAELTKLQEGVQTRETIAAQLMHEDQILKQQKKAVDAKLKIARDTLDTTGKTALTAEEIVVQESLIRALVAEGEAITAKRLGHLEKAEAQEIKLTAKMKEKIDLEKQVLNQILAGVDAKKKTIELDDKILSSATKLANARKGLAASETATQEFDRVKENFEVTKKGEVTLSKAKKSLMDTEKETKLMLIELQMDVLAMELTVLSKKIAANKEMDEGTKARLQTELSQSIANVGKEGTLRKRLRENLTKEMGLQEEEQIAGYYTARNAAEKELIDTRLQAAELENDLAKRLTDLNSQIFDSKMSTIDSERKIEEEKLKVQNSQTRADRRRVLSVKQIAELDQKTLEKKKKLIEQDTKNKLNALDQEFILLRAKREQTKAEQELLIESVRLILGDKRADELKSKLDTAFIASGKLLDMAETASRERIKALGESLISDLKAAAKDSVKEASATDFLAGTSSSKFLQEINDAKDRGAVTRSNAQTYSEEQNAAVASAQTKVDGIQSGKDAEGNNIPLDEIDALNKGLEEAKIRAKDAEIGIKQAFIAATLEGISPMLNKLKELGPQGELVATVVESTAVMGMAFLELAKSGNTAADKLAAVGAIVQGIGAIMAASSKAKIAGIDKEIDAEKRRDGKSKESLAKISALEKKKERAKRKAFEQNKKIAMAETIINTAAAVMAQKGNWPMMILMGLLGAAQLAIIAGTSYQGGGSAAGASTPSSIGMGERSNKVDVSKQASGAELSALRGGSTANIGGQNFMPPPAFMGAQYRAQGGPTAGYVVGEQGPELFVPDVPGKIVPNDEMKQSQPVNVNFTIQAIDTTNFNDALVTQRGNIISMIREAANTYGETFLESVNDTAITTGQGKL